MGREGREKQEIFFLCYLDVVRVFGTFECDVDVILNEWHKIRRPETRKKKIINNSVWLYL